MTETNDGAKSNYTQNYYDARGNVLRVYTGLSAPLTINGLDNVVPNGDEDYAVTKYTYDIKGNLISTTDALGNTVSYDVDLANKRIKSTTDKNQNTFVFEYDAIGNVTSKSLADGTNAETTVYGLTGQVLSKTNDTSSISYIYDDKGRLISETDSALGTVKTYTYDEAGNRLTFTLTRNGTTQISQSYVYDKLNRLTSVSENGTVIATYTYDNKNNRTKTTVPNGETTNYSYNLANMLTSQTTGNKLNEQYTYYLNGNQKTKTSNGETTNYIYDGMNRLVRENNTSYTFDDFGNRLTMSDGTATTAYTYDLNNRLIASTETNNGAVKNTRYSYDYNGNQISKLVTSTKASEQGKGETVKISDKTDENVAFYEYNCYNQVIEADTNGVKSNYAYSPDGLRQSKTVDGNTITFVYDNANVVEEITQDGTNKYYRGFEIVKNDDNVYYLYNGQGDVAMLIDNTGETVANYSFDAYGNQSEENTIYNPFGYRGEYQDLCSGLIYLRNRYYDPSIGRFISEDTHWNPSNMIYGDKEYKVGEIKIPDMNAIMQSSNLYAYCMNNPMNFVDPSGMLAYPGQIHNLVVNKIASIHGLYKEQTINYNFGWGRADLISSDGAVWDVKRDKPNQIASGVKQVNKYVANEWKNNPNTDLYVGGYIDPGSFVVTLNVDTYYVDYHYAQNGVIAYDYYKVTDWEQVGEYAKNALGVVVIAGCSYAIYQSGGSLAPVLLPVVQKAAGGY